MKRFLHVCIGMAAIGMSVSAWSAPEGGPGGGGDHPCKKIAEACKAAGFVKGGGKSGNGIMENCMKPIMEGQSAKGVSVDPSEVAACKVKMAERAAHGGGMAGGMAGGMGGGQGGHGGGMSGGQGGGAPSGGEPQGGPAPQ